MASIDSSYSTTNTQIPTTDQPPPDDATTQDASTDPASAQAMKELESIIARYLQNQVSTTDDTDSTGTDSVTGKPELEAPAKDVDPSDLVGLLMKMKSESTDLQIKTGVNFIQANKSKLAAEYKDKIEKIKESFEAMEKAKKSGIIGKIFGWIGAIVTAIVGAILIATGVGAVAGGLMLAAAAVMITQMSLSQAMEDGTLKMDPKAAQIMMITLSCVAAVLAIAGGVAAFATAPEELADTAINIGTEVGEDSALGESEVSEGITDATTTSETVTETTSETATEGAEEATQFEKVAEKVQTASNIAQGANSVGSGAANIATAVYDRDAADAQADAKAVEKFIAKIQAALQDEQDKIKELIQQLQQGFGIVADIMKQHDEAQTKVFQNMSA